VAKESTDHAFQRRDAVDSGGLYVSHYREQELGKVEDIGKSWEERHLWFEPGEEQDVPTDLIPPDFISQAASNVVLKQNSRRRSCGLCYIRDYVWMPQGGLYSSFLPKSCSIIPVVSGLGVLRTAS
jgi:hypothetical protein